MMRRVYLSFLGLGQYDKDQKKYSYRKTVYEFAGKSSQSTRFVQAAEQMLLGWDFFDVLYIAATETSADVHLKTLCNELTRCRGRIELISLDEDMSEAGQWQWFEKIFSAIRPGDEVCVDLTHGYRSIPVIFSAAINFLQKTKQVKITHVLYGAYEKDKNLAPIVDMRSFFDINIWADAVTRLTNDADARGFVQAGQSTGTHQFSELSDPGLANACDAVTRRIINIDVNNVSDEVTGLLHRIEKLEQNCPSSSGSTILLRMIREKFADLTGARTGNPDKNGYTLDYFSMQLSLARLLLDHGLFMQAFTVMREWLASLVMLHFEKEGKMKTSKRRKRVQRYGTIFFNMLQFAPEKWNFKGKEDQKQRVQPFYDALQRAEILAPLIDTTPLPAKELSDYRNGFDHAWLGKREMKNDLEEKGRYFHNKLEKFLHNLRQSGLYS